MHNDVYDWFYLAGKMMIVEDSSEILPTAMERINENTFYLCTYLLRRKFAGNESRNAS